MYAYAAWNVDASQILSRRELTLALLEPKRRCTRWSDATYTLNGNLKLDAYAN